ncbi:MAG: hypothetical protein VXW29_07685, partial [SAR324 cluster bacterium]|nr:hypothetical protein [SAR324 cluster bacterium]
MRKIFWCLLLWPWVLWANEEASPFAKLQWSGWASKAWMQTDPEPLRLSQQEDEGWEAALRLDWVMQPWLSFRALYAYLPYLNDGPDSEFEFLLLDANTYLGESIVGTRLGRLQLPYGFYNMQRLNPADRLGIHHAQPMQIYWGQNSAIFDRGDGWMTYFYTPRSSSFQAQFELGRIVRDYPEPQEDYLTVLSELGMELDRQENQFASIELEFLEMIRLRKDHHEPTHFIQIPYSYYEKLAEQQFGTIAWSTLNATQQKAVLEPPGCDPPPTGEFTRPYVIDYEGLEMWWEGWQFTLEQSRLYYTIEGTQQDYYSFIQCATAAANSGLRKRRDTHHSVVLALHTEQLTTHIGYGDWSVEENNEQIFGGTHRFGGLQYKPHL